MFLPALILFFQVCNEKLSIASGFTGGIHRLPVNRKISSKIDDRKQWSWNSKLSTSLYASSIDGKLEGQIEQNVTKTKVAKTTRLTNASNSTSLLQEKAFALYCQLHCTLILLRKYFPKLLDLPPIPTSTAQEWIYDSNLTITGPREEQLAVGIDEVMAITRALAVVTTAARRAGNLLDMAVAGNRDAASAVSNSDQVKCELIMDSENPFQVLVLWETRLPQPSLTGGDKQYTVIAGRSILELSRQSGRVSKLQIQKVKINGVTINESLGSALATIRSTARSSPLFESLSGSASSVGSSGNPLLDGILSGIRDVVDAVDALPSPLDVNTTNDGSPLYILPESDWKNVSLPADKSSQDVSGFPIEEVDLFPTNSQDQMPVMGSKSFVEYTLLHKSLVYFAKYGLHQLAGSESSDREYDAAKQNIRTLFSTDVKLVKSAGGSVRTDSSDDIILLKGAGNVADLYRSLALFRQTSGGDWGIRSTETNWKDRSIVVSWESKSPLKIEGSDKFIFEKTLLDTSSNRLPLISDGDLDGTTKRCRDFFDDTAFSPLKIDQIKNLHLTVSGVAADSEWANAFIAAASRTGMTGNAPIPDPTISELLRALANRQSSPKTSPTRKKEPPSSSMPLLDNEAAASFYGILRSLHLDLSNIGNTETRSLIPAGAFVAYEIELRGLLRERLVSGSQGYNRLIGVAISSLRAAIQTGRVRLAAAPKPKIEVTSTGTIKVDFLLALWIDTPTFPLAQSSQPSGGFGVPLKIQLVSEYMIDNTGKISEHVILESRLNGVLTPGDVFSRWIKGLTSPSSEQVDDNGVPAALEQMIGALNWVRSMQDRIKKK